MANKTPGYPLLNVFGNDYPTKDGTGVRDYIHVVDLARGHLSALHYLYAVDCVGELGYFPINLGTGQGTSVLEMIQAYEQVNKIAVPYKIVERRPGDLATVYADNSLAKKLLNWEPSLTLFDMVKIDR